MPVKVPFPFPLIVLVIKSTVGFADVLQQIPLLVTGTFPSNVTLPFTDAELTVILVVLFVFTTGNNVGNVVNTLSAPYAVPTLLVA